MEIVIKHFLSARKIGQNHFLGIEGFRFFLNFILEWTLEYLNKVTWVAYLLAKTENVGIGLSRFSYTLNLIPSFLNIINFCWEIILTSK